MEFMASHRFAKISPRKARLVIDLIRGYHVSEALELLRRVEKRAAYMIDKVLRSAIANAVENGSVDADALYVAAARVDPGPVRKWHRPRSRGMWNRIRRRTSHIWITLSDELEGEAAG